MDGSSDCTVSLTIDLPSDSYMRIEQLAQVLGVTVSHAAAMTIFAGQLAQQSFVLIDDIPTDALSQLEAAKRERIIDR